MFRRIRPPSSINRRQFLRLSARTAFGAAVLGSSATALPSQAHGGEPTLSASGDQLFQAGLFAEADLHYAEVLAGDPANVHALIQRGYIALLSNQLARAADLFEQSLDLEPENQRAIQLLALTFYRGDDFADAAGLGYQTSLLQRFQERVPYEIHGPESNHISLLQTTPLLLVDVAVNGLEPVPFVVDTGSSTLVLRPELAQRAGTRLLSPPPGAVAIGAGGQQLNPGQMALVDSVTIGDFEIRNIPGLTGGYIARDVSAPDGRPVEGAIGTIFLGHFLTTLDYPGGDLILRRRTPSVLEKFEADAEAVSAAEIPFWIYTDHLILAIGSVNGYGPVLFAVDTGANADYGSMAFLPSDAVIEQAGIQVDQSKATRFVGSGGVSTVYPIQVDELALGPVVRRNLTGAVGVWPSPRILGGVEPVIGGAVSNAFLSAFALTIDTAGMRLFLSQTAPSS
jgi:predicted aspartyl protease